MFFAVIMNQVNFNFVAKNVFTLRDMLLDVWEACLATRIAFDVPRDAEKQFIACHHKRYRSEGPCTFSASFVIGERNIGRCNTNINPMCNLANNRRYMLWGPKNKTKQNKKSLRATG